MKIGIYAPYLDTYGGGERYICQIAKILGKENDVDFILFSQPDIEQLQNRLNIDLSNTNFKYVSIPGLLKKVPYLQGLLRILTIAKVTKNYDLFINHENFSIIPARAKKNIQLFQLTPTKTNRPFGIANNPFSNLLVDRKLKTYDVFVANSSFTKKWVEEYYKRECQVLYPPIDTGEFYTLPKQNIILSVGRFFQEANCKKQLEMIQAFKKLQTETQSLNHWEYHLVGGVTGYKKHQEYLKKCHDEAQDFPIYFHINAPFQELKELYGKAKIFWHATGLNEDEIKHPERIETFGMTTVEAMSAGCVPIVIDKGGQSEIVRNGFDGFLWNNVEELINYTIRLINEEELRKMMSESSIKRSQIFNNASFEKSLKQILS